MNWPRKKTKYQTQLDSLKDAREAFEKEKERQAETIAAAIKQGVKEKEANLKAKIKADIEEAQSDQLKSLQDELREKSSQLKEYYKAKSEIERLKREKDELREAVEAEAEKKLTEKLVAERDKIHQSEKEKSLLLISEKEKIIAQLNDRLKEAQRKAEQGSTQLQGEVQELAIEDWLAAQFPLDTIEEIKKGMRGGDCLQIVNTRSRQHCGTIYYESKRTKDFQATWIEKFKADIRERKADIGVLVTQAMPVDMERMGLREGIWICTFEEFRGLCVVLRESIIRIGTAIAAQENKGDKMGMLYDFLTGNEFRHQVEAIVEGFTQMHTDLESEKRAMNGIWKKREKQIQKVLLNTNHMYSSIKGIAGSAVQSVPLLEMPLTDDEEVMGE
ncbi:MAG: DUF2130 domain-containing protein [bacterium]